MDLPRSRAWKRHARECRPKTPKDVFTYGEFMDSGSLARLATFGVPMASLLVPVFHVANNSALSPYDLAGQLDTRWMAEHACWCTRLLVPVKIPMPPMVTFPDEAASSDGEVSFRSRWWACRSISILSSYQWFSLAAPNNTYTFCCCLLHTCKSSPFCAPLKPSESACWT